MTQRTPGGGNSDEDERRLARAAEKASKRRQYWERTGEMPLGRALGMMGRFGWTIVSPALLGILIGRWMDRIFNSGVFWSATLLFLGITAGFYMTWKRMHQDE